MSDDAAILSAGGVARSAATTLSSRFLHLRHIALDAQSDREIYEHAPMMLEETQGGGESGVFDAARELIEAQLRTMTR